MGMGLVARASVGARVSICFQAEFSQTTSAFVRHLQADAKCEQHHVKKKVIAAVEALALARLKQAVETHACDKDCA